MTVNNTADNGPGTLRDALAKSADGDTIHFSVTGTIGLTTGELLVTNSVNIVGPGQLILDGNSTSRVFHISSNITVGILSVTISNGRATGNYPANGAGILNDRATLVVSNCVMTGNVATSGYGAGIFNNGDLRVIDCMIVGNTASTGGGLGNAGSGNIASVMIVDSTVSSNTSFDGAGGIYNAGDSPTNATLQLVNSTMSGNVARFGRGGGGIGNFKGTLIVSNSTLDGNSCGGGGSSGYGGGVYNVQAIAIIAHSTLSHNWCADHGGGIYSEGYSTGDTSIQVINSTLSANRAYRGGGIFNNFGDALIQILNSTFSGNLAPEAGNNINTFAGIVEIGSSILDSGGISGVSFQNGYGPVTSLGYNISSDDTGPNDGSTDMLNTDPKHGPLKNNGGPTFTHKPLACSPAIDQGKNFSGLAVEQRGDRFVRTFDNPDKPNAIGGDGTDVGAFEVQTQTVNTPPVIQCHDMTVSATSECTADASIDDGSYDSDDGDALTIDQNPPGPYPLGTNTVALTVTDRCGASTNCTASVIVVDDTPPAMSCPPFIMYLDATSPTGEVVTYVGPTATDDCNPIVILTGVPASGSLFAPGDTVVTFTAVDAAGNTNSCTFIVHVYGAAEQLLNLANHFASGYARQVERSLMRPLQSAARSAAKGRSKPACRAITVFVRHLLSRSAKGQIYSDDVPNSMEAVMRIRALLNCQ